MTMPASPPPAAKPARAPKTSTVPDGETAPVAKGSHLYLIDGSGYIFRAFHALPPLTRPSDGLPVGAVHGFVAMLWKLIAEARGSDAPTHLAVIFDAGAVTFRNEIYSGYKSQRPPPPEELVPQFQLIRDCVKAFNVACVELDGYEADDLIATYARSAADAGADVTIVSSDKDLMQLVGPGIAMLDTMKARRIGTAEVVEKFGVAPERVIDVQALAGDSVDNVPGVPGIGIKTAAELINQYGDLDTLLARAGEIKQPKRREKLIEFAEQARISRQLVTLKLDTPTPVTLDQMAMHAPIAEQLLGFLRLMEFTTLTKKIASSLGVEPPQPGAPKSQPTPAVSDADVTRTDSGATPGHGVVHGHRMATASAIDSAAYTTVTSISDLEQWVEVARAFGRFAFDTETTSFDPMQAELVGFAMAVEPGRACYVPVGHICSGGDLFAERGLVPGQIRTAEVLRVLKPLLEDPSILKIGHNFKGNGLLLRQYGVELSPIDDTQLISYALDGGRGSHALDALSERHLSHTPISFDQIVAQAPGQKKADRTFAGVPIADATRYAAGVTDLTLRLWLTLKPRLMADRMTTVYETLERPLVPVLIDMEAAGIKVDRAILSRLSATFAQSIAQLDDTIQSLAAPSTGGQRFQLGSPKQLGELLFDVLKLPGGKRTKSGQWETRAGLLDDLASNEDLHEDARRLINTMLEWRQLSKLRSTYTDALPEFIHPKSGRIHTSYSMAATTTGRLASTEPNLQNIPIRTKEGREIRTAFIADAGAKLISADYSQIELRVLAHIADIPQLRRAFDDGLDIHAMTASEMFGVAIAGMPSDVRRRAKAINFGIIYGISAFGLANQLSISKEEAGDYIRTYFKRFPGIRDYMDRTKKFAHDKGFVETVFGRRIHYPEINTRNPSMRAFLERAAINAPIQGSAADIIRRAMVRAPTALADARLGSVRMLLQVHDELIFEAKDAEVETALSVITTVMEGAPEPLLKLAVPLKVDAKAAANWDGAH